jgi:hypothetical protein
MNQQSMAAVAQLPSLVRKLGMSVSVQQENLPSNLDLKPLAMGMSYLQRMLRAVASLK